MYVPNVSSIFRRMLQVCLPGCCIYFTHMLQVYLDDGYICNDFQVFSRIFASVSDVFFKCFICLLLHVASGTSEYFKSRSGVAHVMRVGSGRGRERSLHVV
jgi:hypothetical protein